MRTLILTILALNSLAAGAQQETHIINRMDPGYVSVFCTGNNREDARTNCFQKAIETMVGIALLSNTQAVNNKLAKDEIIKYSAGYIDNYKIIEANSTVLANGQQSMAMDVIVKSSKIHERLLNSGKPDKDINGDRMATQYNSYLSNRRDGDRLFKQILDDYPKRAIEIKQGAGEFKLDQYRNAVLIIPVEIRWNYNYLVSMKEALTLLSDGDEKSPNEVSLIMKKPEDFIGSKSKYYFNDSLRAGDLAYAIQNYHTQLVARILDNSGQELFVECYDAGMHDFADNFKQVGYTEFVLRGGAVARKKITIKIEQNSQLHKALTNAGRVEMSLERGCRY